MGCEFFNLVIAFTKIVACFYTTSIKFCIKEGEIDSLH